MQSHSTVDKRGREAGSLRDSLMGTRKDVGMGGWHREPLRQICSEPAPGAWQVVGGSLSCVSLLCCSWGSARPLQRLHVREEGPPPCPGEDPAQPVRLHFPHDEERDKNTGVGCHFLLQCMKVKS